MDIIQKSEAALRVEKVKVDELLLNILPRDIAEELKASGKVSPISYESVSVLFTDFVGFSALSKSMDPPELLRKLDLHFSLYDDITARYGIEKLKTIGDSYMCAGGIPSANFTHPIDIVLTALEMQRETERLAHEEAENGMDGWHVRLGIHTGPLAAGIIGTKKFVYDIWGDTVNIASRMESAGLSGSVNISGETAELIRDFFAIQARGMIEVKNRGSLSMYLVSGILPELSDNGEGLAPNAKFRELRDRYTERKRG